MVPVVLFLQNMPVTNAVLGPAHRMFTRRRVARITLSPPAREGQFHRHAPLSLEDDCPRIQLISNLT